MKSIQFFKLISSNFRFKLTFVTLVDIYHQPGGFQENILTVVGTFSKDYRIKNNTSFESPDKELLESGEKLDMALS